jgi:hypothetical protein
LDLAVHQKKSRPAPRTGLAELLIALWVCWSRNSWQCTSFRQYGYAEAGLLLVNEPARAELRIRKISSCRQQGCSDFEHHEVWGSRFRG